jgi:hypothetical protein
MYRSGGINRAWRVKVAPKEDQPDIRSGAWKNHAAERENKDGSGSFVRFHRTVEAELWLSLNGIVRSCT